MNAPLIGQSVKRKEDLRFLTGGSRFTDDIALPGQTYAFFLRSPHAHARIRSMDLERARSAPGVVAVFNGKISRRRRSAGFPAAGSSRGWTASR